jgi:hypothetical protein
MGAAVTGPGGGTGAGISAPGNAGVASMGGADAGVMGGGTGSSALALAAASRALLSRSAASFAAASSCFFCPPLSGMTEPMGAALDSSMGRISPSYWRPLLEACKPPAGTLRSAPARAGVAFIVGVESNQPQLTTSEVSAVVPSTPQRRLPPIPPNCALILVTRSNPDLRVAV